MKKTYKYEYKDGIYETEDGFLIYDGDGSFPLDKVERKNKLLKKFHCECNNQAEREAVLRELFGAVGKNPRITPLFYCDLGCNIFIGDNFYSNYNLTVLDCARVTIGNNCYIADNVGIYAVGHAIDRLLRRVDIEYGAPVTIGDDVWIGGHSVINPGVTIGDNVVIGSGSVVTHDIESGVVAAGNPCRVLRKIDESDKRVIFKSRGKPSEEIEYPKEIIEKYYGKDKS